MTKGFPIYFALCTKNSMFYVLNGFEITKKMPVKLYRCVAVLKFNELRWIMAIKGCSEDVAVCSNV